MAPADALCAECAADGQEVQDALYSVSGSRTVPQVFVDGSFIGGADGARYPTSPCYASHC